MLLAKVIHANTHRQTETMDKQTDAHRDIHSFTPERAFFCSLPMLFVLNSHGQLHMIIYLSLRKANSTCVYLDN